MFDIHKVKPVHGWREFFGEVGIIVLGILIALGLEQVVERVHWHHKVDQATDTLRESAKWTALTAIEQKLAAPCIDRQLALLEIRVLAKAPYQPAPAYSENGFTRYVVRVPSRKWNDSAWTVVTGDGTSTHLLSAMQEQFDKIAKETDQVRGYARQVDQVNARLNSLSLPLTVDPASVVAFAKDIEEMRAEEQLMTLSSGLILGHIQQVGMMPTKEDVAANVLRASGTVRFCRNHGLTLGMPNPIKE